MSILSIKAVNFSKTSEWLSLSGQHLLYMHRHRIHLRKDYQWLVLGSLLHDDGLGWWFFRDTSIHQFVELLTQLTYRSTSKVQAAALRALGKWQRAEDIPLFFDLARTASYSEVQAAALRALIQIIGTDLRKQFQIVVI